MANIFKAKTLVSRTGIFSHEVIAPNLIYNTGNQTIDGLKDFTTRPTVNTIPVLLSGENANGLNVFVKNDDSTTLYKSQPVYIYGANGNNILVRLAKNTGETTSSKTLGLLAQDLSVNAQGYVITEGALEGINTNAGNAGDPIWLGESGNLIFGLANKPYAPNHLVYLGVIERKQSNNGKIYVKIQNGFELQELHNVNIDHSYQLTGNQVLKYNSQSGLWFNQALSSNDLSDKNNIVYTTGDQIIYNNKIFLNNIGVSGTGVFNAIDLNNVDILSISGVDVSVVNGNVSLTNRPTVNGTGVVLSGELERIIINSGALLNEKINSLSGYINSQDLIFSGQIASTGSILDNKINALSGTLGTNVVYLTGNQNINGTKNFYNTPTINGDGILSSGQDIIGGDLTGDLLSSTINKLQGYPVNIITPSKGQVLSWNGSTWIPGANANGGGGGGGIVYYFNFANYDGIAPSGGLPITGDSSLSLLGRAHNAGSGEFTSPNLDPQNSYKLVTHFVSASGDPGLTNIPAGIWDFNVWAKTSNISAVETQLKAVVNIYNPTNSTYRYVNQSDEIYLFDGTIPNQYTLDVVMPQTGIQSYERLYIQFWAKKTTSPNKTITFYFDNLRPSHVHTTIPSIAGSGVVKIVDGIYQTPATLIFNTDIDNNANINQSKIANLTTDLASLNSQCAVLTTNLNNTGSTLNEKINSLSGWAASANNLLLTGSTLDNKINSLSGYVNSQNISLSGQIFNTGSRLDNKINALSGSAVLTYGNQNIYGIKNFYSGIVITGDGSTNGGYTLIAKNSAGSNGLQFNPTAEGGAGNLYFNAGTTSKLYNVGDSTLQFYANSNQYRVANSLTISNGSDIPDHTVYVVNRYGHFGIGSGFSNPLERLHVSGGNLRVDGNIIGNNVLGNNLVYITGDQTISGTKNFADTGVFGTFNTNYAKLTSNPLSVIGSGNTFVQLNIQNLAIGNAASSDLVLTTNAGTDDSFYVDLGINNSGYNQAAYNIGSSGDAYLYVHGGNLTIGTQSPNRTIKFHTDGTTSANQIAEINSTGYFSPNKSVIALSGIFGINNTVLNTAGAFIGGGSGNSMARFNTLSPINSSIVGGASNCICSASDNSFIGGGTGNCIGSACFGFIGGGCSNRILNLTQGFDHSTILNGKGNAICFSSCQATILNGVSNCLFGSNSTILNGCSNFAGSMVVVGGRCNNNSYLGGESFSFMYGSFNTGNGSYGVTFGLANRNENEFSSVLGGCCNIMLSNIYSENNVIAGGGSNRIGACSSSPAATYYAKYNFIGGGLFNRITGSVANSVCANLTYASTIVGGQNNTICSDYSAILGGRCSEVGHHGSTVIGDGASRIKRSVGACTLALDFCCGISLANNTLFDATPQILTVRNNFNITTGYNSRMILVNSSAAPVTGFLTSGQVNGFNATIMQVGNTQVLITGSGIGVTVNEYANQYRTAGIYAAISVIHTGNNGYIMYGNTAP